MSRASLVDPELVDAAERRRALEDLDTTLLVEAAAGSGKTTLLLGRILGILRAGRARLGEIAAITFTEKAAADLRIRLRSELELAGLRAALRDLEAARIGTIHAFAATLLRERPVEAGVDPGFTVADPLAARLLLDATWETWLEESLESPERAAAVRQAIELGLELEALRELAYALVDERDHLGGLPEPVSSPEPLPQLNGEARVIVTRLEALALETVKDPEDKAAARIRDLAAWARQTDGLPEPEQIQALLEAAPLPDRVDRLGAQTKWRDRARLIECRTMLRELADRVAAARAVERHNLVAALARWACGFVDAYQRRKARAGSLDFLDLLLRARDLVRDHPDVRRDFQRQIRYLLVDEFQDTDPLQLEMILCLGDGAPPGSLFIVGDPKQSIYRFRRADIETYERAKATVAARGAVLTIRANFRSDQALLETVNRVFDGVMVPPEDGVYQPAYVPLEPSPRTQRGAPPAILQLPDDAPPPQTADEALAAEARLLAAYLRREVEGRGRFGYGDVAMLFRAMTGVGAYEDAFREAGVPFRTVGGRHYYDRSEVGWAIAVLGAIEDPHDPVALIGSLRSPFFGLSDESLLRFRQAGGEFCYLRELPPGAEAALAEAWALLRELHRDRNALAPPALIERLYTRTEVLAAYALDPHGEARVANLLKVLDTARALEATGALTFRAFVRWLQERGAARYEEEESVVEGEDVVRLMTIHKAKGLEFPVVVVPDLCREAPSRSRVVLADRASGAVAISLGKVGGTPVATLGRAELEAREQRRADAETLRLLYVALTRAERHLVLAVPARVEPAGFFLYLGPALTSPPEIVSPAAPPTAVEPRRDAVAGMARRETLVAWRENRRELLARGAVSVDPEASSGPRRDGTRLDALVRAALAAVDLGRPDRAPAVVAALGARHGAAPELVAVGTRLLAEILASPATARARRAPWCARDVTVTAEVDGALVEGRADFLFEEPGGLVVVAFAVGEDASDIERQAVLRGQAVGRALGRPVRESLGVSLRA